MRTPLLLAGLVSMCILGAAARADACPCCDPCSKYDFMRKTPPQLQVNVYVREQTAAMANGLRRPGLVKLLTGARWIPRRPVVAGAPRLRLLDRSNVPDTVRTDERSVIMGPVALRGGRFVVEIDGAAFVVSPCRDDRNRATTCLVRQGP